VQCIRRLDRKHYETEFILRASGTRVRIGRIQAGWVKCNLPGQKRSQCSVRKDRVALFLAVLFEHVSHGNTTFIEG